MSKARTDFNQLVDKLIVASDGNDRDLVAKLLNDLRAADEWNDPLETPKAQRILEIEAVLSANTSRWRSLVIRRRRSPHQFH